jgi:hypothetical protein
VLLNDTFIFDALRCPYVVDLDYCIVSHVLATFFEYRAGQFEGLYYLYQNTQSILTE